jgi:3-hydroxyisobutyrate dehydrogenase-like beta-hydroxyacid dehydrogenase
MSERVAFLGLGIMGSRMANRLVDRGFDVTVWNRTQSTAEQFCDAHPGVRLAHTPGEAGAQADIVVTMVVDGPQVEHVLLGPDGVAAAAKPGTLCIDCSTIGPSPTRQIAGGLAEHGVRLVDAPVTGSSPRAEDGTLTIMVGGSDEDVTRARAVLDAMGSTIVHAGPLGHGQMVKLINNAVAASNAAVLGEALVVGAKAGLNLDALVEVMGAGSGNSTMLGLKAGPMRQHDYTTLFKLDHMLKDVRLCLDEGVELGTPFAFAALTREVLIAASGRGHGDDDFAAMIEVLEAFAGTKL